MAQSGLIYPLGPITDARTPWQCPRLIQAADLYARDSSLVFAVDASFGRRELVTGGMPTSASTIGGYTDLGPGFKTDATRTGMVYAAPPALPSTVVNWTMVVVFNPTNATTGTTLYITAMGASGDPTMSITFDTTNLRYGILENAFSWTPNGTAVLGQTAVIIAVKSAGTHVIYIDGVQQVSDSNGGVSGHAVGTIGIGRQGASTSSYASGSLAAAMMFGRPLSANEAVDLTWRLRLAISDQERFRPPHALPVAPPPATAIARHSTAMRPGPRGRSGKLWLALHHGRAAIGGSATTSPVSNSSVVPAENLLGIIAATNQAPDENLGRAFQANITPEENLGRATQAPVAPEENLLGMIVNTSQSPDENIGRAAQANSAPDENLGRAVQSPIAAEENLGRALQPIVASDENLGRATQTAVSPDENLLGAKNTNVSPEENLGRAVGSVVVPDENGGLARASNTATVPLENLGRIFAAPVDALENLGRATKTNQAPDENLKGIITASQVSPDENLGRAAQTYVARTENIGRAAQAAVTALENIGRIVNTVGSAAENLSKATATSTSRTENLKGIIAGTVVSAAENIGRVLGVLLTALENISQFKTTSTILIQNASVVRPDVVVHAAQNTPNVHEQQNTPSVHNSTPPVTLHFYE